MNGAPRGQVFDRGVEISIQKAGKAPACERNRAVRDPALVLSAPVSRSVRWILAYHGPLDRVSFPWSPFNTNFAHIATTRRPMIALKLALYLGASLMRGSYKHATAINR